jgi:hypothetical protein
MPSENKIQFGGCKMKCFILQTRYKNENEILANRYGKKSSNRRIPCKGENN